MEKNQANANEHKQTGEDWDHLSEPQMIGISRENDDQNENVDSNPNEVVARDVALVSFQGLAQDLICLHTEVQVNDHEDHKAVYHTENLLNHYDPITEAEVR